MKKFLLSGLVVLSYIIYSVHQRTDGRAAVVVPPKTLVSPSPTASPSPVAVGGGSTPVPTPAPAGQYKDGQYTGPASDAYYGYIQVRATISGGRLTAVTFLQYPNDRGNSIAINQQAMPYLQQEAIQAQSANVDSISGATDTSQAFVQSLSQALAQAKS